MKFLKLFFITLLLTGLISCSSVKLTSLPDISNEELITSYRILKDEIYGTDKEQKLDIYISNNSKKLKDKNFTIIFLHGGGYYLSDKTKEEKYIQPYLKKGLNVVNVNYRLKRGIPLATEDLTNVINYLKTKNDAYKLNLDKIVLTGFSAGGHIASNVGVGANNSDYPYPLNTGVKISAIINFSGPVDGLDVVEKVFVDNEMQLFKDVGNALFPSINGYTPKDTLVKFEPITFFDKNDPSFFLWHGGQDDQIPPTTFTKFVGELNIDKNRNFVLFVPNGKHDPTAKELKEAYEQIFTFLDRIK
ncbi:alpha/beta hydrolase [Rhabdobacter roseus]|uniref:Acetyl esterase/lipase n=1 Tax=Rhabdobacter roseus TaxID=1655419 RepID=A0A840TW53_9BACT|nr:alpha/beta hydrolase fold domain-containing protein [Rhabdobacter roseus]MBB5287474.1 acetyl esterase/lipase [Rhabdobacter roseus]